MGELCMSSLERILVQKSVQKIGSNCFSGCQDLNNVTFEEGSRLQSIGEKALMSTYLTHLLMHSSVYTVAEASFYGVRDVVVSENSVQLNNLCECGPLAGLHLKGLTSSPSLVHIRLS